MVQATDAQMQTEGDQFLRPFAEAARSLYISAKYNKSSFDDIYARATSTTAWSDARTGGPLHLLQSGNGANPDDMLNFNAFITALTTIIDGTDTANDAANAAAMRSAWPVLMKACVRPANS